MQPFEFDVASIDLTWSAKYRDDHLRLDVNDYFKIIVYFSFFLYFIFQ